MSLYGRKCVVCDFLFTTVLGCGTIWKGVSLQGDANTVEITGAAAAILEQLCLTFQNPDLNDCNSLVTQPSSLNFDNSVT